MQNIKDSNRRTNIKFKSSKNELVYPNHQNKKNTRDFGFGKLPIHTQIKKHQSNSIKRNSPLVLVLGFVNRLSETKQDLPRLMQRED